VREQRERVAVLDRRADGGRCREQREGGGEEYGSERHRHVCRHIPAGR